jgi:hypothetical protein
MALNLIYQMFAKLLSWMVLHACGVPEVGPGSLTGGDRWLGMIVACRCGCCMTLLDVKGFGRPFAWCQLASVAGVMAVARVR